MLGISPRAYGQKVAASSWEEIWEAGPYYDRLACLLEDAREYAILVGWQIDSRLRLTGQKETLKEKVVRLCREKPGFKVFFLFWDHAYIYVFERELWQSGVWENLHPNIHFVFDGCHPLGASHHEKICIVDGEVALCGGIDLCDERWDSPDHLYIDRRRSLTGEAETHGPYHDIAVQVSGPICGVLQEHVRKRWNPLSPVPFPIPKKTASELPSSSAYEVYLSRTWVPMSKTGIQREVEFLFRDLIGTAEKRIIFEGQYYWSKVVNDLLISKIHQMRNRDFQIILILSELQYIRSLTHHMMVYEVKLLRKLQLAAEYSNVKLSIMAPYTSLGSRYLSVWKEIRNSPKLGSPRPIYIHSKVLVIDDTFLGIGSANLADRALRIDSEVQLTLHATTEKSRQHVREVAQRILDHWGIENPRATQRGQRVYSRNYKPNVLFFHLPKYLERTYRIPWQHLFDPPTPWFYILKLRYIKMKRGYKKLFRKYLRVFWVLGIMLILAACLAIWITK